MPQKAIIRDMGLEHVFVLDGEKAMLLEVASGVEQGGYVEIVDGLTGEERVVVEGQFGLKEGDPVSVTSQVSLDQGQ